jgi:hypothetical protein
LKNARYLIVLCLVSVLAMGGWSVLAQEASDIPQLTIEKSADGYVLPAEIPEGVVQVTFNNTSENSLDATFARLNEGVTGEALGQALSEAGPMGALSLVTLVGGASAEPGATTDMYVSFKPGEYVLLDTGENAPAPSLFTVADAEGEGAAAPEADVQVSLLDFAFSLPLEMSAGESLWQINNNGSQWHEMVVFKIDPETTLHEMHELAAQMSSDEEPSVEVVPAGFLFPISQGERAWVNMNLEAGTYLAICFLPDFASGHAHFQDGMMQVITVS